MSYLYRIFIASFIFITTVSCLFLHSNEQGKKVIDEIPIYNDALFIGESKTTYPDSTPSISRTYQSKDNARNILTYYKSEMPNLGWAIIEIQDTDDPLVVKAIIAEKEGWTISILIGSGGSITLRVFL